MTKRKRGWQPGMYEGKTPDQVAAQVGTAVPTPPRDPRHPNFAASSAPYAVRTLNGGRYGRGCLK